MSGSEGDVDEKLHLLLAAKDVEKEADHEDSPAVPEEEVSKEDTEVAFLSRQDRTHSINRMDQEGTAEYEKFVDELMGDYMCNRGLFSLMWATQGTSAKDEWVVSIISLFNLLCAWAVMIAVPALLYQKDSPNAHNPFDYSWCPHRSDFQVRVAAFVMYVYLMCLQHRYFNTPRAHAYMMAVKGELASNAAHAANAASLRSNVGELCKAEVTRSRHGCAGCAAGTAYDGFNNTFLHLGTITAMATNLLIFMGTFVVYVKHHEVSDLILNSIALSFCIEAATKLAETRCAMGPLGKAWTSASSQLEILMEEAHSTSMHNEWNEALHKEPWWKAIVLWPLDTSSVTRADYVYCIIGICIRLTGVGFALALPVCL